ncbi:MAG: hypothetical protein ACRD0H_04540, partial [Actinomycetes bacterium]
GQQKPAQRPAAQQPAAAKPAAQQVSSVAATQVVPAKTPAAATKNPATGPTNGGSGAGDAGKAAAHRLPSGSYPDGGDGAPMRPRADSDQEPGDLFRPTGPTADQGTKNGDSEVRTSLVPTVAPQGAKRPAQQPAQPAGVESTVKVGAVRPGDNTVLAPAPKPPQKAQPTRPEANNGPSDKPAEKAHEANRSTSVSRSG